MSRKVDATKAWPEVAAEYDELVPEKQRTYEARAESSRIKSALERRLAKDRLRGGGQTVQVIPSPVAVPQALTPLQQEQEEDSLMGLASQNVGPNQNVRTTELPADAFAVVSSTSSGENDALPEAAKPMDLTNFFARHSRMPDTDLVGFGQTVSTDVSVDTLQPFNAELLQSVFEEKDYAGNFHKYSDCDTEYRAVSEQVYCSEPFPDKVQYPPECGCLCECYTPPAVMEHQKLIKKHFQDLALEASPTGKQAHMPANGIILAVQVFGSSDGDPDSTFFGTMVSALGSWFRFPSTQMFVTLEPTLGNQAVTSISPPPVRNPTPRSRPQPPRHTIYL